MNRKVLIFSIISVLSLTLVTGIIYVAVSFNGIHSDAKTTDSHDTTDDDDITPTQAPDDVIAVTLTPQEQDEVDKELANFVPPTTIDLDPSSITVFVNREYNLPKTYKPEDLVRPNISFTTTYNDEKTQMRAEAAKALEKLFAAADKAGYPLTGISAYRSYSRQYQIFRNNIITQGKTHTLKYSAVPGTSEHQTGLSIDISAKSNNNKLNDNFADTPEGRWVAKNAHLFGFIVRYPKDKADITGYAFEPWHIRYVGRSPAYYMYEHKLTFEEYYQYTPNPNFNFEEYYAAMINYTPPTKKPYASPTPTIILDPDGNIIDGEITPSPTPPIDTPIVTPTKTPTKAPTKAPTKSPTKPPTHTPIPTPTPSIAPNHSGGNSDEPTKDIPSPHNIGLIDPS